EAEGQAAAILSVAAATAEGIRRVAEALQMPGGAEAVQLRVAEQYIEQFGKLARSGNSMIVPANLADVSSMLALATNAIKTPSSNPPEPRLSARVQPDVRA
ncbi:MAG TPA: band-7 C-terminal domain-containing protein, partial [Thermoanaerobaculia bacterium]|nr:band-7 C-terminal domain-containing protein [Thermoanaerobaculia bacterium]